MSLYDEYLKIMSACVSVCGFVPLRVWYPRNSEEVASSIVTDVFEFCNVGAGD